MGEIYKSSVRSRFLVRIRGPPELEGPGALPRLATRTRKKTHDEHLEGGEANIACHAYYKANFELNELKLGGLTEAIEEFHCPPPGSISDQLDDIKLMQCRRDLTYLQTSKAAGPLEVAVNIPNAGYDFCIGVRARILPHNNKKTSHNMEVTRSQEYYIKRETVLRAAGPYSR
ncbi:hypothetical protein EVAR_62845_1 [Eumeta japonica]|uniref:Uncharacterized protein n=1 Tax=Eumeta variegata TaxID=151549 RepID=A0A4C1ZG69_EUMVA|nr:hypothetical protein EVAR_62845_1 [Eumeta japonica]